MRKDPYNISSITSDDLVFPFYFISDTHLSTVSDIEQNKRIEDMLLLLETIKKSKGTLFILGDFFDFWFSKGRYIPPSLQKIVDALCEINQEGNAIHYIAGNHDFWLKGYIQEQIGFQFYPNALSFSFQNKMFFLHHGDRITSDRGIYPLARKLMRSFWAIALLKILPIRWTYFLGEKVSHYNRTHDCIPPVGEAHIFKMQEYLKTKIKDTYDYAISGHVHAPSEKVMNGKKAIILGDWIHHRSYGYMDESGFELRTLDL